MRYKREVNEFLYPARARLRRDQETHLDSVDHLLGLVGTEVIPNGAHFCAQLLEILVMNSVSLGDMTFLCGLRELSLATIRHDIGKRVRLSCGDKKSVDEHID